jgi:transposase
MERYTSEFRQDAVSLVISSGRPIKEIARELGINGTTLGAWVRAERKRTGLTGSSPTGDDAEMEENKRLKRRIVELEKEREILKRATAFWVKESNG